jgi:hypothetical protein
MADENISGAEGEALTQLARIIYEQMNVEPRRMNVAIEVAKRQLTEINRALIEQGLRTETESSHLIGP